MYLFIVNTFGVTTYEYYLDLVIRQQTITALFSLLYPTPRFIRLSKSKLIKLYRDNLIEADHLPIGKHIIVIYLVTQECQYL